MPNVQEYEGSFDLQIPECDIDAMIEYNVNDVEATETLLNKVKEDVELRLEVEKEWGFDALSMSGVRFGEEVLLRKTLDITNTTKDELKTRARKVGNIHLGDIILPFIQYSNPKLKEVLLDVKNATCNASKSDKKQEKL